MRTTSETLFDRAQRVIPGGVNSPVRAFQAVGGTPLFIKSARGAFVYDEDGRAYIELINSWGPMVLGHPHPLVTEAVARAVQDSPTFGAPTRREVEMAERITAMVPSVEQVRMVNSGTEATMSAVRLARGYTGRDKLIKFTGCYHGHGDSFLIAAGSGATTLGTPDSPGVTRGTARDTLTAPFGDLDAVAALVHENPDQVAAVIIEPVAGNMGCVVPPVAFLQGLRRLCDDHGIVLIFDEVMTGFRLAAGGAQERLGVRPDLTTLGKIIGGGLPVGAYGGRREIMARVSPSGPVYQAGTLSGNPVAMAAGLAVLTYLDDHRHEVYPALDRIGQRLTDGLAAAAGELTLNQIGSMYTLFFTAGPVTSFDTARQSDLHAFGRYFHAMLARGVYLAPSQFESLFLSTALTHDLIDRVVTAHREAMAEINEQPVAAPGK